MSKYNSPHENMADTSQRMPYEDLDEMDTETLALATLALLTQEAQDALKEHFTGQQMRENQEMLHRMLGLLTKTVSFSCFPFNESKLWGMIYALDLPFHEGMNMSEKGRQLGKSRANISGYATDFCNASGMPPSRWMRSEETADRSKQAREKCLTPLEDADAFFDEDISNRD